ncbi:MAG TPA: N-acetylmuramoyl-L-alanine amidase [Flavisolibacter sp.]|nr:N-acetylmuramoyl-L-alanine amidase [Flavisolibacter sp.]
MLKKLILAILLPASTLLFSFSRPHSQQVLRTIIIDAGHGIKRSGGYDGASGTYSHEDDIALAVSKRLVALMGEAFPDVKIIETRPTKYITDLHERADIANQNKGDLFISIHVNAMPPIPKREFLGYRTETYYTGKGKKRKKHTRKVPQYRYYEVPNTSAKGTQTYIWGAHKSEDKEVAVRENAPMLSEENYKEKYGDIDVNSPEFIALSLVKTQQFARRSSALANMVEEQFAKAGRISGGSKQRQVGIWVLQATAMPSVLVETGFITNPQEEDYLNSEKGQQEIAECVTNAVKNYKAWLEKKQITADNNNANTGSLPEKNQPQGKTPYSFLKAIEQQEKKRTAR